MIQFTVPWGLRRPRLAYSYSQLGGVARATLLGAVVGGVVATAIAYVLGYHMTSLMLGMARARALDHLELGILSPLQTSDFTWPYPTAEELDARLAPAVSRLTGADSGLVRLNVVGADGTILFSSERSIRGRTVPPLDKPELTTALAGGIGQAWHSSLSSEENLDLRDGHPDLMEVYVPITLDARVVGAYEIYLDSSPLRRVLEWLWIAIVVCSAAVFHAVARWELAPPRLTRGGAQSATPGVSGSGQPSVRFGADAACSLTQRELEVLRLMAMRDGTREIARELVVSEETVRSHVKSVLRKLRQPSRTRAVVAAFAAGILQVPEPAAPPSARGVPAPATRIEHPPRG